MNDSGTIWLPELWHLFNNAQRCFKTEKYKVQFLPQEFIICSLEAIVNKGNMVSVANSLDFIVSLITVFLKQPFMVSCEHGGNSALILF